MTGEPDRKCEEKQGLWLKTLLGLSEGCDFLPFWYFWGFLNPPSLSLHLLTLTFIKNYLLFVVVFSVLDTYWRLYLSIMLGPTH